MIPIPNQPEVPTHARVVALAIYPQEPRIVLTVELLKVTEETVSYQTVPTPTPDFSGDAEPATEGTEPAPEPEPVTVTTTVTNEKRLGVKQVELTGGKVTEIMAMAPTGTNMYDCIKDCVYSTLGDVLVL